MLCDLPSPAHVQHIARGHPRRCVGLILVVLNVVLKIMCWCSCVICLCECTWCVLRVAKVLVPSTRVRVQGKQPGIGPGRRMSHSAADGPRCCLPTCDMQAAARPPCKTPCGTHCIILHIKPPPQEAIIQKNTNYDFSVYHTKQGPTTASCTSNSAPEGPTMLPVSATWPPASA